MKCHYPGWEKTRIYEYFHQDLRIFMQEIECENYAPNMIKDLDWCFQVLSSFLRWWNAPSCFNFVATEYGLVRTEFNVLSLGDSMSTTQSNRCATQLLHLLNDLLKEMKLDWNLIGISNCDKVKKAKKLLDSASVNYEFRNYREDVPSQKELKEWSDQLGGVEVLVNKRSTTYKELGLQSSSLTEEEWLELCSQHPTLIQRPLLVSSRGVFNQLKEIEALLKGEI